MRSLRLPAGLGRLSSAVSGRYGRLSYAIKAGRTRTSSDEAQTYLRSFRTHRLQPDTVLYQAHTGAGMVCNPFAIFRALLDDPEFSRLTHVWVLDSDQELTLRRREYAGHRNVRFVRFKSREYLKTLATAGYLIQNTSFPSYFVKRPGQVYVNTWHSAGAVKRMGFDMPDGVVSSRNVLRNLLMADVIISPNPLMTKVFTESYRLRGLYPGRILEAGYPRNDVTLGTPREEVIAELAARGVRVDPGRKIILYAPTWRGTISNIRGGAEPLEQFRDQLGAGIDLDEYQILIKPHQYHYSRLTREQKRSGLYIPRQFNANRLLAAVDILVSDFSSIFFDFMVTGRPILFYIPDRHEYSAERGVYFTPDQLPGPSTDAVSDIASWVNRITEVSREYEGRYTGLGAVVCAREDGRASERAVDVIFRGHAVDGLIEGLVDKDRTRLLFHVSDLHTEDVARSLEGLLAGIDPGRYDVTVAGVGPDPVSRRRAEAITGARVLVQAGAPLLSRAEAIAYEYIARYGPTGLLARVLRPERALDREFRRRFGQASFDIAVEYSAYPGVFTWMAAGGVGRRVLWQHSDLASEIANRQKWQLAGTVPPAAPAIRALCATSDTVVATSQALRDLASVRWGAGVSDGRFRVVESVIDAPRVEHLREESERWPSGGDWITADVSLAGDGSRRTLELPALPPAPESVEPSHRFVTMAPLEPGTCLEELVLAFGDFVADHPNSRLYVIGEGSLEADLRRWTGSPELGRRVCFTGPLRNPLAVLRHCDCFVLASSFAGFPATIPDVRLLGLPLILGRFPTAGAVSEEGGQLTVEPTRAGLRGGLEAFVRGEVPPGRRPDIDAHNQRALRHFEELVASL